MTFVYKHIPGIGNKITKDNVSVIEVNNLTPPLLRVRMDYRQAGQVDYLSIFNPHIV